MIHYSCDRCGCTLNDDQAVRYVVRMEMEAALNLEFDNEIDDDQDCLLGMDLMLEKLEDEAFDDDPPLVHQRKTFDLCPSCFREFTRNPVGRERVAPFGFSSN